MAKSTTFAGLARRIKAQGQNFLKLGERRLKNAAVTGLTVVVDTTPIDTGRARRNWQTKIGSEPSGIIEAPGRPASGGAEAKNTGRQIITTYKLGQGGIFIANHLDYIKDLDDGYSKQNRQMVAQAISAARKVLK